MKIELLRGRRALFSFAAVIWTVFWFILASGRSGRTFAAAAIGLTSGCCLLLYWSDCIYINAKIRHWWIRSCSFIFGAAMVAAGILAWMQDGRSSDNWHIVAASLMTCGISGILTYAPPLGDGDMPFCGRGSFCAFWDKVFSEKNCFKSIIAIVFFVLLLLLLVADVKYRYYNIRVPKL